LFIDGTAVVLLADSVFITLSARCVARELLTVQMPGVGPRVI
jgi:hypothetical protein